MHLEQYDSVRFEVKSEGYIGLAQSTHLYIMCHSIISFERKAGNFIIDDHKMF